MWRSVRRRGGGLTVDGNYVFGAIQLPEHTQTCFRRTITGNEYYYSPKDVVYYLANTDLTDVEYRVVGVVHQDRNALKSYLAGEINTCPQIDQQLGASYQLPITATVSAVNEPAMSLEKMNEQRERHAAQMKKTLQKSYG